MTTAELSRRQFLKGTGALIVSFNLFPSTSDLFAQSTAAPGGEPDPTQLDSWIAVASDGTVTVFTSKVELGTGIETALAQIAAEELDVSWRKIKVDMGDTSKTIDQATTSGSRTIERAGPQIRQAAAAARKELLRLAAEKLGAPVEKLTVRDGVVSVARQGSFVGIVAKTQWAAIQAAQALKVNWSKPATKLPANADELYAYLKNTKSFTTLKAADKGDPNTGLAKAKKQYEATFRWPFQMHGMIGPSCAVADVRGEQVTIWSGCQGPFRTRASIATLLNIPEKNVRIIYHEASGSYGRMSNDDGAEDAALLSRAVGAPVRVQWSRQDEHGWEPKGPAQLQTLKAGVDDAGKIIAWEFTDYSLPWTVSSITTLLASEQVGIKSNTPGSGNGNQGGGEIYNYENSKVFAEEIPWMQPEPFPLRTSNLRAPGQLSRCFASESLLNEIAADLGVDPVEFRLRYLTSDQRGTEVLKPVADKSRWQKHPAPALK